MKKAAFNSVWVEWTTEWTSGPDEWTNGPMNGEMNGPMNQTVGGSGRPYCHQRPHPAEVDERGGHRDALGKGGEGESTCCTGSGAFRVPADHHPGQRLAGAAVLHSLGLHGDLVGGCRRLLTPASCHRSFSSLLTRLFHHSIHLSTTMQCLTV